MKSVVSVILTTKNSNKTLKNLFESIKEQSYKKFEVILVDNGSIDGTVETAKKYTNLSFQKGPERSSQRNFGAKKAKGDFLFFLDSDMVLTPDVIKECVKAINYDNNCGGLVIPEKSFGEGLWSRAKIMEREIHAGEDYFEAARFFPKNIFFEFKGYNETLTGPEDWDLPQRISKKYKISRIKSYILHNEGNHTLLGLAKKKYYYGLSVYKYLKNQEMSIFNKKTIYILRPAFYKKWRKLTSDPLTALGMVIMLFVETIGGGLGYLVGFYREKTK